MDQSLRTGSADLRVFLTASIYFVSSSSRQLWKCPCVFSCLVYRLSLKTPSSILSGRVLDIQGAGIPGANVRVKNTETGLQRRASVTPRDTIDSWDCLPGTTRPRRTPGVFKRDPNGFGTDGSGKSDSEFQTHD